MLFKHNSIYHTYIFFSTLPTPFRVYPNRFDNPTSLVTPSFFIAKVRLSLQSAPTHSTFFPPGLFPTSQSALPCSSSCTHICIHKQTNRIRSTTLRHIRMCLISARYCMRVFSLPYFSLSNLLEAILPIRLPLCQMLLISYQILLDLSFHSSLSLCLVSHRILA